MARRPVFQVELIPPYYKEVNVDFKYYSGFSVIQKKKSIDSLHRSFKSSNMELNILEISSKSEVPLGMRLSAFNLKVTTNSGKLYPVENVFQSSKVFEKGGPYIDLLKGTPKDAKKDKRLKESGKLIKFICFKREFGIYPKTYFYDWLYINTLYSQKEKFTELSKYDAFTDIEFNPKRSINCQARSVAIYVSLVRSGQLEKAIESKESFLKLVYKDSLIYEDASKQISLHEQSNIDKEKSSKDT